MKQMQFHHPAQRQNWIVGLWYAAIGNIFVPEPHKKFCLGADE